MHDFPITDEARKREFLRANYGRSVTIAMLEDFEDGPIRLSKGESYPAVVAKYDEHPDGNLAVSFLLNARTPREVQTKIFTFRFDVAGMEP